MGFLDIVGNIMNSVIEHTEKETAIRDKKIAKGKKIAESVEHYSKEEKIRYIKQLYEKHNGSPKGETLYAIKFIKDQLKKDD